MSNKEILKNNSLISEFINGFHGGGTISFKYHEHEIFPFSETIYSYDKIEQEVKDELDEFGSTLSIDIVSYHNSWDWLVPVIKECLNKSEENLDEWEHYYEKIDDSFFQVEILQTWIAVVEFIKWYNANKK